MDGIATFLIGGVLGVALGYLASRKNPPKGQQGVVGRTRETPYVIPPRVEQEPTFRSEPVEAATPAAAIVEAPEDAAPEVETAAAVELPEAEPVVSEELVEEASPESAPEMVEPEMVERAVGEAAGDDLAPVTAEEPQPWEIGEAEGEPVGAAEEPLAVADEGPITVIEEETAIFGTVPGEIEFIDMSSFEAAVAEPVEAEVAETSVGAEPVEAESVETVAAGEAAAEPEASPAVSPVDDLKARIEETRRRIRRELEQPFLSADEIADVTDWTSTPAVRPVEPAATEPVAEPASAPEPAATESVDILAETPADDDASATVSEEVADYDSMRSRIEVTRSRLKAKAFDAMMTGESALLGRDPEDAQLNRPARPTFDSEIDETIETGLREQET